MSNKKSTKKKTPPKPKKVDKSGYGDHSIQSFTKDRDRVWLRPGIYIPGIGVEGAYHIVEEIFDNNFDELNNSGKKKKIFTFIVEKVKDNFLITCTDNGRGMPLGKVDVIHTVLSTGGKYDNHKSGSAHKHTGGTNGYGAKLACFFSEFMVVDVKRDDTHQISRFEWGEMVSEKAKKFDTKKHTGTSSHFKIDPKRIPGIKEVTPEGFKEIIKSKSFLYPDIQMNVIYIEKGKEVFHKTYMGKGIDSLLKKTANLDTELIRITETRTIEMINKRLTKIQKYTVPMDLVFGFSKDAINNDPLDYNKTYCNSIFTTLGGKHLDGLREGLVKFFKQEIPKYLTKKDADLNIAPRDIHSALASVVWVGTNEPDFRSQFKDMAMNDEFRLAIRDAVYDKMKTVDKKTIEKMVKIIKKVAAGRELSKGSGRKSVDNAFSKDAINKYEPLLKTINTTWAELLIVEGDTALDPILQGRDHENQAIYAMTGKPANIYDLQAYKIMKLQTAFNDLIDIFGCGVGKNFDIDKMKFKKVIFETDADIDGIGMVISLLSLIYKFMFPLIKFGYIYRNMPPLLRYNDGKKSKYVTSQKKFYDKMNSKFIGKHKFTRKGQKLDTSVMETLLTINIDYVSEIDNLVRKWKCSPEFAEQLVYVYNYQTQKLPLKKQLNKIKKAFKDHVSIDNIEIDDGIIKMEGTTNDEDYIFILFDNDFIKRSRKIRKMQAQSIVVYGYGVDKEKNLSLLGLMQLFTKEMPGDISRYKGLGELDAEMIKLICLDPTLRTLIRYKSKDVEREIALFDIINSAKVQHKKARKEMVWNMDFEGINIDT